MPTPYESVPLGLLYNRDHDQLTSLQGQLEQTESARVVTGLVRTSGLRTLGPAFERLVCAGRLVMVAGSRRDQLTREVILWFHERGQRDSLRRVDPSLGLVHAGAWWFHHGVARPAWAIMGSANVSRSAYRRNIELGASFPLPPGSPTTQSLQNFFDWLIRSSLPAIDFHDSYASEQEVGDDESSRSSP